MGKEKLTKNNSLMFETVRCSHYLKKIKDGRHIFRIEKGMRQNSRTEWEYAWCEDGEYKEKEVPPEDFGGSDFIKTYYERTEKDFTGIVVGFDLVTTKAELYMDCSDDECGYYEWVAKNPKEQIKCARVYYGCNRSRMVPLDDITILKEKPRKARRTK